jgi:aryl-alcohol dehydrogenase-like predicted oxidoreductase
MKRVPLGSSGLLVSPLTVGCWSFGGDADSYWGAQSQADVDDLVRSALDRGVNFFDTAFGYNDGRSEESLGRALVGLRHQAVICNKIPLQPLEALPRYEQIIRDSLRRLGTDWIDVMMIHWPAGDESVLRANLDALVQVRERGLIRQIGVSNFGLGSLAVSRDMGINVVANEFAYNLLARAPENAVIPWCIEHRIGLAAYMPLMQGILAGKYRTVDEIPPQRKRSIQFDNVGNPQARHGGRGAEAELFAVLGRLGELSEQTGLSRSELAIAWLAGRPGVSTIIAGCRNTAQLMENAAAVEIELAPAVSAALDAASEPLKEQLGDNLDLWQLGSASRVW